MEEFDQSVATDHPVTAEDLECLQTSSPAFREWVWDAFLTGRLDVFVAAVIRSGAAANIPSALRHLADISDTLPFSAPRIAVADFERKVPRGYRLRELRSLLDGEETGNNASIVLRHGSIGHEAIQALLTDQLLAPKRTTPQRPSLVQQLSLFIKAEDPPEPMTLFSRVPQRSRSRSFRLLKTIERLWSELAAAMEIGPTNLLGENDWTGWQQKRATAARLRRSLRLLFAGHVEKLETSSGDPRTAIHMLSLMSWASAVSAYRRSRTVRGRILFREVPVFASAQELGGGRIDALEVRAINGGPPTRRDQQILAQIAQTRQFHSSGELLRILVEQFHRPLDIAVIDWKFLVGDVFVAGHDWRYPDLESGPLAEHERQIRRYLTLIPVDYHLADRGSDDVWHPRDITLTGVLMYFVPHRLPILHEVTMTPDETEARFIREVVHKWGSASRRSSIRRLYNGLIGHLVQALSGTKRPRTNGHSNNGANGTHEQGELFGVLRGRSARSVVERHREKATIVVAGTDGTLERQNGDDGTYTLRYDRLLAAIEAGKISSAPNFDPNGGGKIGCVFPGHHDSTPSMQIYLSGGRPRFWCFGCCSGGMIALDSIPKETIQMHGDSWRRNKIGRTHWEHRQHHRLELEVDDSHHGIMTAAQALLANAFRGSDGERYIRTERRLDPDLAAAYGAGYGTLDLLNGMLDAGFSFDDLVRYGFLSFSGMTSERSWVVGLLERRGIPRAQQYREIRVKERKERVRALPYLTLSRRVTFPLMLLGQTNSIYGRAAFPCSKHQAHRKLKVAGSRVKHGGFNMRVLEPDSGYAEVVVLEGVMDALTLAQVGHPNALAMVGVQNAAILTAIVQSGKAVATGLDLDSTGRKKTADIGELLAELGYRQPLTDFTANFFGRETPHPNFKDFNEWLKAGCPDVRGSV